LLTPLFLATLCTCTSADIDAPPSDGCAYSASGVIATPLDTCSVYAQKSSSGRSYSYSYSVKGNDVFWNLFSDEACTDLDSANLMDSTMLSLRDSNIFASGEGAMCDTVDIVQHGAYTPYADDTRDCTDSSDYTSMSFVVNECIADASTESSSAMLLCDNDKIWVNYYSQCTDCHCDMEQYAYKQYSQDACWEVTCNAVATSGFHKLVSSQLKLFGVHNRPNEDLPDHSENAAEVVVDSFVKAEKPFSLDELSELKKMSKRKNKVLLRRADFEKVGIPTFTSEMESWATVLGLVLLTLSCGVCRYINSFDRHGYNKLGDGAEDETNVVDHEAALGSGKCGSVRVGAEDQ